MSPKLEAFISWACLPIYIWQGLSVREKTPRLPPPNPQQLSDKKGKGKPYRILLIGDSSAAGVGVNNAGDALGGQIAHHLSERSGKPVITRIAGSNSATSAQLRDHVLPHIEFDEVTHVILSLGTNDAKNFHTGKRFCREFGTLLYALNAKFPGARILWSGILDFSLVPTLPKPLNQIMGIRSRELMRRGEILCNERLGEVIQGTWNPSRENFSHDGFHASEKGYSEWGAIVAEHILNHDPSTSPHTSPDTSPDTSNV